MSDKLTHLNEQGAAHMVDVGGKQITHRSASAEGYVVMKEETLLMITEGRHKKGDVFATCRIAGIMAAKKCSELIPLCHALNLSSVTLDIEALGLQTDGVPSVRISSTCKLDAKTGVAIFESTQRHPLMLLYMLITPILVWINTPFIRPFRWKRLFWTYVIPLTPLVVMFDGFVSCLRTYTVDELQTMVSKLNSSDDYKWEIGLQRIGFLPVGVTFLIGYPISNNGC